MSVQPTTPPDSHSLLAVVSSIMDFPAPGIASPEDYARLVGMLDTLCPLQHFAMLGLADGGLNWRYTYQLPDVFKQQLGYLFTRTGLTASVLPGWDNLSSRCTP
ncbi:hypothetical protein ACV1C1_20355, partial [Aeromonas caviae]